MPATCKAEPVDRIRAYHPRMTRTTPAPTVGFSAVLQSGHKQDALEVPFDPAARWNQPLVALWPGRRGYRVHVESGGIAFDSAIVARSRRHWLLVEDGIALRAGWTHGQAVDVRVSPLP